MRWRFGWALWLALVAVGCHRSSGPASSPIPPDPSAPATPGQVRSSGDASARIVVTPASGCAGLDDSADASLPQVEQRARIGYRCSPIDLLGTVLDEQGAPVSGATVRLGAQSTTSAADGRFAFHGLLRKNALLRIDAEGLRSEVLAVELRRPLSESSLELDPVRLVSTSQGTRILFGGDFSLGRRFLDPTDTTPRGQLPPDNPEALIRVSDPVPGSHKVVSWAAPLFAPSELRVLNLETAVTDNPATPHLSKAYAFFTLPQSLVALDDLGVQYTSLGNNHVYDYLDQGLADTLAHVTARGLGHSGAGPVAESAFIPWHTTLGGTSYAFVSACSISGDEHDIDYVASDASGGAADLRDTDDIAQTLQAERAAGRAPIALWHTGIEYSDAPEPTTLQYFRDGIDSGAALVIGNHPHVPQGFAWYRGHLAAYSLGNFAFDQDRLETMLGLLAQLDLEGDQVHGARTFPVYLEDYRPRPVAGALADRMLRRIAALSLEGGVDWVLENGRADLLPLGTRPSVTRRHLELQVDIPSSGHAIVDLRGMLRPHESLASVDDGGALLSLASGVDLLGHGDFEDHDVDEDQGEVSRWELGSASFPCLTHAHAGVSGLCLQRAAGDLTDAIAAFRNRVRVPGDAVNRPNKDLTLLAWASGDNAGPSAIQTEDMASEGDISFGSDEPLVLPSGTYGWTQFAADLHLGPDDPSGVPDANPRAIRLTLQSSPPAAGESLLALDDVAVIAWDPRSTGHLDHSFPNPSEFLRVEGAPGVHSLELELARTEWPTRMP